MVNMNISPSGVVIGARPPLAPGQVAHHAGEALADLLARPVDVGAVVEVEGHVGQRVLGGGAQDALVRDAQHLLLDGHRDARLDLLRRHAGALMISLTWVVETSGRRRWAGCSRPAARRHQQQGWPPAPAGAG